MNRGLISHECYPLQLSSLRIFSSIPDARKEVFEDQGCVPVMPCGS